MFTLELHVCDWNGVKYSKSVKVKTWDEAPDLLVEFAQEKAAELEAPVEVFGCNRIYGEIVEIRKSYSKKGWITQ